MESTLDSNGRELLAILYSLKSFKSLIQGKVVKLYTDSKNASIIASKGSTSLRLQRLALEIFQFCAIHNVSIEIEWVPRSLNEYADSLSRVIDFDDWSVSSDFFFFVYISSRFGPFTVDRFASPDSAKCARFYSKWTLSVLIGRARTIGWCHQFTLVVQFFIWRYAALGASSLSPSGFQQLFGQSFFRWKDLGLLFVKWLSFLTLLSFLLLFGMVTIQYFVRLDSSLRF